MPSKQRWEGIFTAGLVRVLERLPISKGQERKTGRVKHPGMANERWSHYARHSNHVCE